MIVYMFKKLANRIKLHHIKHIAKSCITQYSTDKDGIVKPIVPEGGKDGRKEK